MNMLFNHIKQWSETIYTDMDIYNQLTQHT